MIRLLPTVTMEAQRRRILLAFLREFWTEMGRPDVAKRWSRLLDRSLHRAGSIRRAV